MALVVISTAVTADPMLENDEGIVTTTGSIDVASGTAVTMSGLSTLVVDGVVSALAGSAVLGSGAELSVDVGASGQINAALDAIVLESVADVAVSNFGIITAAGGNGIELGNFGVSLAELENGGQVAALENAIRIQSSYIPGFIVNTGTLNAVNGFAIDVFGEGGGRDGINLTILNTGLMSGGSGVLDGRISAVSFTNQGELVGDLFMGQYDSIYLGTGGTVAGTVYGEDGDDTLVGGDVADVLFGGAGADRVRGAAGEDILYGNRGADDIRGGSGADLIIGHSGDDDLFGGRGADEIRGGEGADLIEGNAGADDLAGSAGQDTLVGGAGIDTLRGGADEDTFVFSSTSHSATDRTRDVIEDFEQGLDLIDLSGIDISFVFLGGAGFSGTGGAEVRATLSGADSIVRVDADGDGSQDMSILVQGVTGLTAADFGL